MEKRDDSASFATPSDSSLLPDHGPAAAAAALASSSAVATDSSATFAASAAAPDSAAAAPDSGAAATPRNSSASSAAAASSPAANLSPSASGASTINVAASFAAAAARLRASSSSSSERFSPRAQSSLLHHPRPASLIAEAPANFRSFPFSAAAAAGPISSAAATAARLALPPALPPAPWLWDSSLLAAFATSQQQPGAAAAAARGSAALAPGENPPAAPTAALLLLPTGGGTVLRLEEAYVCDTCCAVRAPEELAVEIEAYYCPNCFDSLTQTEALACGCCCTKCFDCPRCYASLSVMRQPREAAEAAAGRANEAALMSPAQLRVQQGAEAAAAAANQAETIVRRLLHEAGPSSSRENDTQGEARARFSVEESLLAAAAPQRCESLLSLSSDEEEDSSEDQEEEGGQQQAAAAAGERNAGGRELASPLNRSSSNAVEEVDSDENETQQQREHKIQRGRQRERKYLYYFSCPYCRWNSKAVQITSESSTLLPAAAIAEERVGGLLQRYFHQVLDVLQRAARDRERLRQLEARVKHKAVALLFAAAAAHDKRRVHAQLQAPQKKKDEAGGSSEMAAATADEQLLLSGGIPGSSKSWRVTDVEQTLAQRAAQNSFACAGEAWATAYRSDLQQPPQYVGLQQLLRGEHAVLQHQAEDKVMTDILFGWQLQQHEAAQLLKRSRAAREGNTDNETRRRDSALQEHLLEGTGKRRQSSIDATLETPIAIPLHSPQLLLDRPSPDLPPLKLPTERLSGTLLYNNLRKPQSSSTSSNTEQCRSGSAEGEKTIQEWWTAEQATLEQRLRNPNSLIAAATSTSFLRPTRKKLLTRESKRCRVCTRYLVKAHVSSIAVPPFRVNTAAALLLPWIVPRTDRIGQLLRVGDIADVRLNLLNPTDAPVRLKFHFHHISPRTPSALAAVHAKRHQNREGTAVAEGWESDNTSVRINSTLEERAEGEKMLSPAAGDAGALAGDGSKTLDSLAFVTAAETAGTPLKEDLGQHRKQVVTAEALSAADWETVEIVTPDFDLHLDRYDEMLGEFGEFDFASSGSGSRVEDFRSRSANIAAVEWKKGNSAQVRLQVRAKTGREKPPEQQLKPAICCVTIDFETVALQSNTLRVQYFLFLGHVCAAAEKA